MLIRFGYVAIALNILDGSPNKTITYSNLIKIAEPKDRLERLRKLTEINLERLLRVLKYNKHNAIHVFRITSKLIPLATHPVAKDWDYLKEFQKNFIELGAFISKNNMRISFHPDHFTLLNSPNDDIVNSSITTLQYHTDILNAMSLDSRSKLVLHVGGVYNDKISAIKRFVANYERLSSDIQSRIILENDDKNFTAKETLDLCNILNIPMVIDIHHHACCNNGESLSALWSKIMDTWQKNTPKIHFSSPKDVKNFRAHADFIDSQEFYSFINQIKHDNLDFDVMLEAKQKDRALHQLMKDLQEKYSIKAIDATTIEI